MCYSIFFRWKEMGGRDQVCAERTSIQHWEGRENVKQRGNVNGETRRNSSTVALGICPPQGIHNTMQQSAAVLDKELSMSK